MPYATSHSRYFQPLDKSPEAIEARQKLSDQSEAMIRRQGGFLDDFARGLNTRLINGEITGEERREALLRHYTRK